METFGKKLSELRKQRGISQEQLAFDLNISQSSISNYEVGATMPDAEILKKISDYFQVPVSFLFSDEKNTFYTKENNGGNSGYMINSTLNIMSEKLIGLYEKQIAQLEAEIQRLKNYLPKL
jgi:transcriptional regulator with XRE-family HTH domain